MSFAIFITSADRVIKKLYCGYECKLCKKYFLKFLFLDYCRFTCSCKKYYRENPHPPHTCNVLQNCSQYHNQNIDTGSGKIQNTCIPTRMPFYSCSYFSPTPAPSRISGNHKCVPISISWSF